MARWIRDMAERAVMTAAQAFIALLIADGADWTEPGKWRGAAIVAVAAGLSVVKSTLARRLGNGDSASTMRGV